MRRTATFLPCLVVCLACAADVAAAVRHDIGGLFTAVETAFWEEQRHHARAVAAPVQPQLRGRWVTVRATAYSPHDAIDGDYHATKGDRWRWITADGRTDVRRTPYGIAVPRLDGSKPVWPYGTKVYIPLGFNYLDRSRANDRLFTVDDTGSGIRAKTNRTGVLHIDLRFRHEASALAWAGPAGWRELQVLVVD